LQSSAEIQLFGQLNLAKPAADDFGQLSADVSFVLRGQRRERKT
jgi:hypothetical protein